MRETPAQPRPRPRTLLDRLILFCLERRLAVLIAAALVVCAGLVVSPFDPGLPFLHRAPVPVDALPDIGENQQIVFTEWPGRSPQDMEDQVTYPLTASLLGLPGVKTVRASSAFGFSSVYVIFQDGLDFYWARSRILEKLSSLPDDLLPEGVKPRLGPDATGLGQVFWYTLEGVDAQGRFTGGWDPQELRALQDWHVRQALLSTEGVAEVASVGGFAREYQVDVDPNLLRAYGLTLEDVARAVRRANTDVGARTIEVNNVEYLVRGLGFIKGLDDLRLSVVATRQNTPIFLHHVAGVSLGPAQRAGALDRDGREAVGGVIAMRHGANPMEVIARLKRTIEEISPGLPAKTLADGTRSQVRIVPFYDRSGLIQETLGTLSSALADEVLVTILVVMVGIGHLGVSLIIAVVLPMAVLLCFTAMKLTGVDANIVALAGIAISIGVLDDLAIILTENVLQRMERDPGRSALRTVYEACREVSGAIIAALGTTVISFLPVFALTDAEGKLFRPLAFTKTFTLMGALVVALTLVPVLAHLLLPKSGKPGRKLLLAYELLIYAGLVLTFTVHPLLGLPLLGLGLAKTIEHRLPERWRGLLPTRAVRLLATALVVVAAWVLVTRHWLPLGPGRGLLPNLLMSGTLLGGWLLLFGLYQRAYPRILAWCLEHKRAFLALPASLALLGCTAWLGAERIFGWMPALVRHSAPMTALTRAFPGLGQEFMPALDEGSFLFMPSTMPHAAIGEVLSIIRAQDQAISAIPEVASVVGKLGRAESPMDPAPLSMIETMIAYHPEYLLDGRGERLTFRHLPDEVGLALDMRGVPVPAEDGAGYYVRGVYPRDAEGGLIPDPAGTPFRLWRPALDPALNPGRAAWPGIRSTEDIWAAISRAAAIPGTTGASSLQPISARLVMLQSGIRAALAVKVTGPDIPSIQKAASRVEALLRELPAIDPASVVADRILAKPYLEIEIDRQAVAQYGFDLQAVQDVIETAIGGKTMTTTLEGRERYPVRVRYMRELRDDFPAMESVLVSAPGGLEVPLGQLVRFRFAPGPAEIKTENTFLVGYVLFDNARGHTEVDAAREARILLDDLRDSGPLELPEGVGFSLTGSHENHERSRKRMALILPVTLALIFLVLYFKFKSPTSALLVFTGVALAWSGGFLLLWLYGQPWFMDFSMLGASMRELFRIHPIHLSLAIWVGFLALFGIATDDGVVMATYLEDSFSSRPPRDAAEARQRALEAGKRRIRPCMLTTATTILALLPVLTSSGRGSDILVPMAIPSFGGMILVLLSTLLVPVLYCWIKESELPGKEVSGGS